MYLRCLYVSLHARCVHKYSHNIVFSLCAAPVYIIRMDGYGRNVCVREKGPNCPLCRKTPPQDLPQLKRSQDPLDLLDHDQTERYFHQPVPLNIIFLNCLKNATHLVFKPYIQMPRDWNALL